MPALAATQAPRPPSASRSMITSSPSAFHAEQCRPISAGRRPACRCAKLAVVRQHRIFGRGLLAAGAAVGRARLFDRRRGARACAADSKLGGQCEELSGKLDGEVRLSGRMTTVPWPNGRNNKRVQRKAGERHQQSEGWVDRRRFSIFGRFLPRAGAHGHRLSAAVFRRLFRPGSRGRHALCASEAPTPFADCGTEPGLHCCRLIATVCALEFPAPFTLRVEWRSRRSACPRVPRNLGWEPGLMPSPSSRPVRRICSKVSVFGEAAVLTAVSRTTVPSRLLRDVFSKRSGARHAGRDLLVWTKPRGLACGGRWKRPSVAAVELDHHPGAAGSPDAVTPSVAGRGAV